MLTLILLFLLTLNTFLLLGIVFYLINKTCPLCQEELPPKRIFTFKNLCSACERSHHE